MFHHFVVVLLLQLDRTDVVFSGWILARELEASAMEGSDGFHELSCCFLVFFFSLEKMRTSRR